MQESVPALERMYLGFQTTTVRGLVQPHGCQDAIELLTTKVSHVRDKIHPFKRPPAFFGMRFTFPPYELDADDEDEGESDPEAIIETPEMGVAQPESESEDDDNSLPDELLHVTYQTWPQDVTQVLVEVTARRPLLGRQLHDDDGSVLNDVLNSVSRAHSFLTKNAVEFLEAFDTDTETDS